MKDTPAQLDRIIARRLGIASKDVGDTLYHEGSNGRRHIYTTKTGRRIASAKTRAELLDQLEAFEIGVEMATTQLAPALAFIARIANDTENKGRGWKCPICGPGEGHGKNCWLGRAHDDARELLERTVGL